MKEELNRLSTKGVIAMESDGTPNRLVFSNPPNESDSLFVLQDL